jgi:hypothetical protein
MHVSWTQRTGKTGKTGGEPGDGQAGFVFLTLLPAAAAVLLLVTVSLSSLYYTVRAMSRHLAMLQAMAALSYPPAYWDGTGTKTPLAGPGNGDARLLPQGCTITCTERAAGPHMVRISLVRDASGRVLANNMEFVRARPASSAERKRE